MSRTDPKTIDLDNMSVGEEYLVTSGSSYPGMLVELLSTGKVELHGTALGAAECMILKEDALQGNTVDDAYSADDLAFVAIIPPGCRFYGMVASGETIVIGDKLESAGDGTFQKLTTGVPIAVALEASGGALAANTKLILRRV